MKERTAFLIVAAVAVMCVLSLLAVQFQVNRNRSYFEGKTYGEWVKLLDSDDPAVRRQALRALEYRKEQAAQSPSRKSIPLPGEVEALIRTLEDADPRTRGRAADLLGTIGPAAADAVPQLVKALQDDDVFARVMAAQALGEISGGSEVAVPALVRAMKDDDGRVRETAAKALEEIGPAAAKAVPALIDSLKDRNVHVRWSAAHALSKIPAQSHLSVPALCVALKSEPDAFSRTGFTSALEWMSYKAVDTSAAIPTLIEVVATDPDRCVRAHAIRGLGNMGPRGAPAVPVLIEALKDDSREWAAQALGQIGASAKDALPALQALESDPSWRVRSAAKFAIECINKSLQEGAP